MKLLTLTLTALLLLGCAEDKESKIDQLSADKIKTLCEQVGGKTGFAFGISEDIFGRVVITRNYICINQSKGVSI